MQKLKRRGKAFVQLEWGEKPFPYLGPQRALGYQISGSCSSTHQCVFPFLLDPAQCPLLPSISHPTAPDFLSLLSPESSQHSLAPCVALSCPEPGVNLCGVGKWESQSILWDTGLKMESGKRSIEGMGNRGGTSQGTRLCRGSCHWGAGFPPLC